ncbi:MAG: multidrug efflux SMR transporter [Chitinophagaceae bacterium]|nr:multidrug efflux SMR transporter [Chitinophagaceae bacterium]
MGVLFLVLTILAESSAVIFMKLSNGFQHKAYSVAAVVTYLLSFIFLTYALKTLPIGLANAIWAGASTVVVVLLGIYLFKEQLSVLQIFFLALIVIGLVGLNFTKPA